MEWREQTAVGCEVAFSEAQRWMEEVTKKRFGSSNFRSALENGVLLCDLINKLKPGIIKRVNRLSTPIAGLDNVNVFLKACEKLGLNDSQLFHPGDLQDVSTRVTVRHQETSRRLKNVLITIYWLGRKAQADPSYSGPQLNFKAFEGLLGVALSKALEEASGSKSSVRDSFFAETWYPDSEVLSYRREDSVESVDSVESHTLSVVSDCTLIAGSEGFGSDAEAEHCFRMTEPLPAPGRERRNVPPALRRKRFEPHEGGRGRIGPLHRVPTGRSPCVGSKSMSDIATEPVAQEAESSTLFLHLKSQRSKTATVSMQTRLYQARLRESEAKWQEDLNRWKTRRQSLNSDLHKKKEEREQLELLTSATALDVEEQKQSPCRRSLRGENPDLASMATHEAFAPSPLTSRCSSMPVPVSSTGPVPVRRDCFRATGTIDASHHTPPVVSAASDHLQSSSSTSLPASDTDSAQVPVQCAKSLEGVYSGTPQMSASLPRGFRRSEGTSRLSTGVTPRPFCTKTSRRSTQPRFYPTDDSHNDRRERHQLPGSFPRQETDTTSDYKDGTRSSTHAAVRQRKKEEEERGKRMDSAPSVHSFMSASVLMPDKTVSASEEDEVDHRDMRVSLNQTPDSGTDFGFQIRWDSTGAHIKSVQPGSPAQLCHLQAGDEIVALGGQRVAEMSYEQWKANMDAALREGKLLMDIRRLSLNGHPDQHTSSLAVENETKAQVNGHPVNGLTSKVTNRSFRDNVVLTKNKGGSESAISDLLVPSIGASSSSRWSWNAEEERRRQEKWQMEQEHLLQEKYRRDQERLEEAWRRDQQDAALEENSGPEKQEVPALPSGNITHYSPAPFLHRSNSPTLVAPAQQAQEAALVLNKQVQIAASHPTREECDSSSKTSQWPSESYGFTKLSASYRKKSKSTPSLDGSHKQESRAEAGVKKAGRTSQAEQERLQILDEMRKKTPVLTDSSWIRQRSTSTVHKEPVSVAPLRRHESLDNIRSSSSSSPQFSSSSQPLSGLSGIVPYRAYSGRCSLGPGAAIFSKALRQSSWSRLSSISPASVAEEACNRADQHDSASAAGLSSGETRSPELRCESGTDSSSVTPVATVSKRISVSPQSVPAFRSDHDASLQITEKTFPEDDSDTATASSA
ncbi:LIM domain only protein 7b isoform X1 [Ictalurus punctatus]|uniref:LIM domain only protein 7b isoform X1 n=1 Tax=Ictalurus punctatus TaxID=7998 RepID=A0A2D0Q622_ICTPU|nr:LIM domain only protein 7b isoform X1 [Ictalurus punctatus]XP_053532100.1 LIM domain only protein 7b isoform X1 [Ictalurus punctatus]XP_053532101.1 LIM domain only protein 7b isoform X1 [Ictalurus punctatus]